MRDPSPTRPCSRTPTPARHSQTHTHPTTETYPALTLALRGDSVGAHCRQASAAWHDTAWQSIPHGSTTVPTPAQLPAIVSLMGSRAQHGAPSHTCAPMALVPPDTPRHRPTAAPQPSGCLRHSQATGPSAGTPAPPQPCPGTPLVPGGSSCPSPPPARAAWGHGHTPERVPRHLPLPGITVLPRHSPRPPQHTWAFQHAHSQTVCPAARHRHDGAQSPRPQGSPGSPRQLGGSCWSRAHHDGSQGPPPRHIPSCLPPGHETPGMVPAASPTCDPDDGPLGGVQHRPIAGGRFGALGALVLGQVPGQRVPGAGGAAAATRALLRHPHRLPAPRRRRLLQQRDNVRDTPAPAAPLTSTWPLPRHWHRRAQRQPSGTPQPSRSHLSPGSHRSRQHLWHLRRTQPCGRTKEHREAPQALWDGARLRPRARDAAGKRGLSRWCCTKPCQSVLLRPWSPRGCHGKRAAAGWATSPGDAQSGGQAGRRMSQGWSDGPSWGR